MVSPATFGFLIHGFWADRESSMLGAQAAPTVLYPNPFSLVYREVARRLHPYARYKYHLRILGLATAWTAKEIGSERRPESEGRRQEYPGHGLTRVPGHGLIHVLGQDVDQRALDMLAEYEDRTVMAVEPPWEADVGDLFGYGGWMDDDVV